MSLEHIKDKLRSLLESGKIRCFIGYGPGTNPFSAKPLIASSAEDMEKAVYSPLCIGNLVQILMAEKKRAFRQGIENDPRPAALVVKGCDSRAVNVLLQENILKRDELVLVGMPCRGVVDPRRAQALWGERSGNKDFSRVLVTNDGLFEAGGPPRTNFLVGFDEIMAPQCRVCLHRNPVGCEDLVWEEVEEQGAGVKDRYAQVDKLYVLSPPDRWKFWQEHFARCIRCNACKNICPLCYCDECTIAKDCEQFVDGNEKARKTFWIDKEVCPSNNVAFHMHRAMHLAGRCIDCGECERACPAEIPLRLLYNGIEHYITERFGSYEAGLSNNGAPVLATYADTDAEDFYGVRQTMAQFLIKIQELIPALAKMGELLLPGTAKESKREGYPDVRVSNYYQFRLWDGQPVDLDGYPNTRVPLKELFFPESETLYRFNSGKGVQFIPESQTGGHKIVLGARPCNCSAIVCLDSIFNQEPMDDRYFKRRNSLTIIGLACTKPAGPSCFCTSVNISPETTEGMDIRATKVGNDDLLLEPITERGEELIANIDHAQLRIADVEQENHGASMRAAATNAIPKYQIQPEILNFKDSVWRNESLACIGCGTCSFMCPTCHCFAIEHRGNKHNGRIFRVWDSCQFPSYSLEASGFNPRPNKEDRLRQRILHKFKQYPEKHKGKLMCVGCGRCISLCPVRIDLRDIFANARDIQTKGNGNDNK